MIGNGKFEPITLWNDFMFDSLFPETVLMNFHVKSPKLYMQNRYAYLGSWCAITSEIVQKEMMKAEIYI